METRSMVPRTRITRSLHLRRARMCRSACIFLCYPMARSTCDTRQMLHKVSQLRRSACQVERSFRAPSVLID